MSIEEDNRIDEEHEDWINLMYCWEASKNDPDLRKLLVERLPPEVLKAVDNYTDYENFKRLIELHKAGA